MQDKPHVALLVTCLVDLMRPEIGFAAVKLLEDARWPGMRDRLCDTSPAIRKHINIFIDGERAKLGAKIPAGSEVFVLTAISGG